MTAQIGVLRNPFLNSKSKAMFCSSEECCQYHIFDKKGARVRKFMTKIIVSYAFDIKTCPDCKKELFISSYNTKTPKKGRINEEKGTKTDYGAY